MFWLPMGKNNDTIKPVHAEAGWKVTPGQWGNKLHAKLMLQGTVLMPTFYLVEWVGPSKWITSSFSCSFHLYTQLSSKIILLVKATVSG